MTHSHLRAGAPGSRGFFPRTAAIAALAGALLLTLPGPTPARATATPAGEAADPAPRRASSSGIGLFARLGTLGLAEGYAAHPEGPERADIASVNLGEAVGTARGATARATGNDRKGRATAEAGVAGLDLDFGRLALSSGRITAGCSAGIGPGPVGAVAIHDTVLTLPTARSITFESTPATHTRVRLPDGLGTLTLNERITESDGSMTVNALHLRLADPEGEMSGELIVGSTNCGTAPADSVTLTAVAGEQAGVAGKQADVAGERAGEAGEAGPRGVRFEAVGGSGEVVAECVTDAAGRCALTFPPQEREPAYVCVADVPEGYRMPRGDQVCAGPYEVFAGERFTMARPFRLARVPEPETAPRTEQAPAGSQARTGAEQAPAGAAGQSAAGAPAGTGAAG